MKGVLGLFAAIAAVAGIAAAVSKDSDKEDAEQRQREQEIEREERRQTVEAAQRKYIQQMEQQRMQAEKEKREYQMKLANAPKIPIYKTAVPMQCPLCMGQREINESAGEVHCPYCGAVERLEVDHYEIDQAAFQKQLLEEEQLERRNKQLNTALKIVGSITGICLLILFFSPVVGAAFFVPPFLLFCFLLYKRFPEKGGKVWDAIRFPLTCIFVFPLPLTAFFMGSENMAERFSKKARIGMSIGIWAAYAALICVLGGLYVQSFWNAVNHPEIAQYETETVNSVATTTKNAKSAAASTTTQTTNKPQNDGFDKSSNQKLRLGGIDWQIPSYFVIDKKQSTDSVKVYNAKWSDTSDEAMLWIGTEKLEITNAQFNSKKEQIQNTLAEHIDVKVDESKDYKFAGLPGYVFSFSDEDHTAEGLYVFAFHADTKDFVRIGMIESVSNKKSVIDDFVQIVKNASITKDNAYMTESTVTETSTAETVTKTVTETETAATTEAETVTEAETEPVPEIYPQEDAFLAAVVAITNSLATDVFTNDGSRHDTAKYHSYSDTSAFYMSVLSKGTWTEKNSSTWHVDGLRLQPDGYDTVYQTPINFDTIAKVSLDVTFDGSNYIVSNISGIYAIPGKEDIGTNLSYLNSDSMSKAARTVSPGMIRNGR